MNVHDFTKLEIELGHPPTTEDVKEWEARPMFKSAYVQFENPKYNYHTSVNGKQSDAEIVKYFKGKMFNLGCILDNMQKCIACDVKPSTV